ncbi:MerR family DNA-binding protein [Roseovarius nitratireducens]|uniref:MerR family DNA-binding protein n=1 Tax=Roseovarius nitratireducens TaxID=2044597 RepID=UPI000CE1F800|nr:MerR family DNA-binding protein [Roseovarius nitratireducens]
MEQTIGKVAKAAGVRIATIRFYERRGLITQPCKPESGYRTYPPDTVARIRFIRQAQETGFSLAEIGDLLALHTDPDADCGNVRECAQAKRAEVEYKIGQLMRIRDALDEMIASCPGHGALHECTILNALGESGEEAPE